MPLIINRQWVQDDVWQAINTAEQLAAVDDPCASLLVAFDLFEQQREVCLSRTGPLGLALDSHHVAASIAHALSRLTLITIEFPQVADGRGFSIARQLRSQFGYVGELRAVGDVTFDRLSYMEQVGFNALSVSDYPNTPTDETPIHPAFSEISASYHPQYHNDQSRSHDE